MQKICSSAFIFIAPFGTFEAIEAALIWKAAFKAGNKKMGSTDPQQKIKVDVQIVAIAKYHHAECIISDDKGVHNIAIFADVTAIKVTDLPLPPTQNLLI